MPLLFDSGRVLYHTALRLLAPWHPKAKAWVSGRAGLWERLAAKQDALRGCIWMHCASVGEFEQGRPVLEALKQERPDIPVLLTFFSPSGYEARKHEPLATHVDYLPPDSSAHARRFLELTAPRMAVFVKYEFWYHHLQAAHRRGIPTFLIAALFRPQQPFFRWYGRDWRRMLGFFTAIGTQDEASKELLDGIGRAHAQVTGDTRYDRVLRIRDTGAELPLVEAFRGNAPTLVLGSTWPADEEVVLPAVVDRPFKLIIAPHELGAERLDQLEHRLPKPLVRWSELEGMSAHNVADTLGRMERGTLLVDRMGLLARLYAYGDICYVGGGFGDGIHNLLEAAVWDRPVFFGPRHEKFPEAESLRSVGGGWPVNDRADVAAVLAAWAGGAARIAGRRAGGAVRDGAGATANTMAMLREFGSSRS